MTATNPITESDVRRLTADDPTRRFYDGQPYRRQWLAMFRPNALKDKIDTLNELYPHHRTIKATKDDYECDMRAAITNGLLTTAASWFLIYQFAKRGVVAPVLRQYGSFFKTHRVFRHYLYTLVLPVPTFLLIQQYEYLNHVEHLWSVHANRMNNRIFTEPMGTIIPQQLKKQRVPLYPPRFYRTIENQKRENEENELTIEQEVELRTKKLAERERIERENETDGGGQDSPAQQQE